MKTRRNLALIGLALGIVMTLAVGLVWSQERTAPDRTADKKALEAVMEAYMMGFNKGDAKATAASYAQNADFLDATGHLHKGREAIEKRNAELLSQNPGMRLKVTVTSVRFLRQNVGITDGTWTYENSPKGYAKEGLYTNVSVKRNGEWSTVCTRSMVPFVPSMK